MPQLGRRAHLPVLRQSPAGLHLNAGHLGTALLPRPQCPATPPAPGGTIEVFIYLDSDDSLLASTALPAAEVDDIALLKVTALNDVGAFLDWGLSKELLLPHGEQQGDLRVGDEVLVIIYLDQRGRLVASMRLERRLSEKVAPSTLRPGDKVKLVFVSKTELGYKCAVNGQYWGLIYASELQDLPAPKRGNASTGYVLRVRRDQRLDIGLKPPVQNQAEALSTAILEQLQAHDGFLALSDKTSPDVIRRLFKVSKGVFKRALGQLYKQQRIVITDKGIFLPEKKP